MHSFRENGISLAIELPWPPSANRYWRRKGHIIHVSTEAKNYKNQVAWILLPHKIKIISDRIYLNIEAYPPDKRMRDLDNLIKITLDSLQYARLFENDEQIDKISIERKEVVKSGKIIVSLQNI